VQNPFKILTIDPDPQSLKTITNIVRLHPDYQLTHLDSTALIYEIIQYQDFEMALCDFTIAANDQFQLVRTLRKTYPGIGILLLVNSGENRFSVKALEAGADGFFNKPFTYEEFALTHDPGYWKALDRADWWKENSPRLSSLRCPPLRERIPRSHLLNIS
jgi:DNA-binding NtrC family response regulator